MYIEKNCCWSLTTNKCLYVIMIKSRLNDDGTKKDTPISLVNFTACSASDKHTMQFFLGNIFRYYQV